MAPSPRTGFGRRSNRRFTPGSSSTHGLFTRLHLEVTCRTEFGQTVHVSGSSYMIGQQDPSAAIEMVTTPEQYPLWRTRKPIIVPRNEKHSYMYALFEGGRFSKWESLSTPRKLFCTRPVVHIRDSFDRSFKSNRWEAQGELEPARSSRNDTDISEIGGSPIRPPAGSKLYIVCFHLPLKLSKDENGRFSVTWKESLIALSEDPPPDSMDTHWVGTISSDSDFVPFSEEEKSEIIELLMPLKCTPLFLPDDTIKKSYHGYCKQILWPAFHNIDVLDLASCGNSNNSANLNWDKVNALAWFDAFVSMNQAFAHHMIRVLREIDVMWVHDYHLMLLPKMVADADKIQFGRRRTNMVFFQHIPFPTSQIFRSLVQGELLLQGMLSANIVGFHSFDHARHFLNAGKRLLGLSYQSIKGGLIGVEYDKRTVMVVMSHVGVEPKQLNKGLMNPETEKLVVEIRKKHGDRIIIGGLDVCQKLSGVSLKLLSFERFLAEFPAWKKKVVLVQHCLVPGTRNDDELQTSEEIVELTKRIKDTYGSEVLDYSESKGTSVPLEKRIALYLCSDVLLFTALREGLNLFPLEYIFVRSDPYPPGVVLVSEFSASSSLLNGAIRINPFDVQSTASSLDQALRMESNEKAGRRARDLLYISSRPSSEWTYQVLADMWAMSDEASVTHMEETMALDGDLTHEMSMKGFTALRRDDVVGSYKGCKRRIILLDYGGTLLEKEGLGKYLKRDTISSVSGRRLSQKSENAIRALCADSLNTVFIISGLHPKGLVDALGHIQHLGLAANNGLAFSWPPEEEGNRVWEIFDYGVDWEELKLIAMPLLNKFTSHTNGSTIKIRDTGLAWSYYFADPEWGQMQAKQLTLELETALAAFDIKVQHVQGQIEVVPHRLHKGVVAKSILSRTIQKYGYPDFVLCMGDDVSDEHMYTSVYSFLVDVDAEAEPGNSTGPIDNLRLYMCTVGKKPTHATFYVDDATEVEELIVSLSNASISMIKEV